MARKGVKNMRATKTTIDGIEFASKAEAKRYSELLYMQRAKEIIGLRCHPEFLLRKGDIQIRELRGEKVRKYTADFAYVERTGKTWPKPLSKEGTRMVVEDVKGRTTPEASLRMSVFKALYPELELRIIKQTKRRKTKKKIK